MDRDVYAFIRRAVEKRGGVRLGVGCLQELTGARCTGELTTEDTPMGDHPSFKATFLKPFPSYLRYTRIPRLGPIIFQDDFWG